MPIRAVTNEVIKIRLHGCGWKAVEAPGVEPARN